MQGGYAGVQGMAAGQQQDAQWAQWYGQMNTMRTPYVDPLMLQAQYAAYPMWTTPQQNVSAESQNFVTRSAAAAATPDPLSNVEQQAQTFAEWQQHFDPQITQLIQEMIDAGTIQEHDLDHSCMEELHRTPVPQAVHQLTAFKEAIGQSHRNNDPIRNKSAYLTKLLKNPGGRGGRGGGRGGRGRGRGRGDRPRDFEERRQHAEKALRSVMGDDTFDKLDSMAVNFASKQDKDMINYIVEEWRNQAGEIRNPSAWITKILSSNATQRRGQNAAPAEGGAPDGANPDVEGAPAPEGTEDSPMPAVTETAGTSEPAPEASADSAPPSSDIASTPAPEVAPATEAPAPSDAAAPEAASGEPAATPSDAPAPAAVEDAPAAPAES